MDKRLINSINNQIEKLKNKIEKEKAEIIELKNRHDKFVEMLEMLEPKEGAESAPKQGDMDITSLDEIFTKNTDRKSPAFMESAKKKLAIGDEA